MDSVPTEKDQWISEKIKKLLADGTTSDEKQAYAIALSMWEDMQKAHMARMPILPAKPCKTVDGRDVTQKIIDAVLAYDVNVRPAVLKLNTSDAHGGANTPSLATFDRTYADGDWIYGDLTPADGYGTILPHLAGKNGPYPFRSIEVDKLELNGGKRLWLEAVSLCGGQKPALNLPPAQFSATGNSKITYTISLTGDEKQMDTTKQEPDQALDMAKIKSELEADFAKKLEEKEASLREEFGKQYADKLGGLQAQLDKEQLEKIFNTTLLHKVRPDERDDLISLALSLKNSETKVTFAKKEASQYDAFLASLEARPAFRPKTEVIAGGVGNELSSGQPATAHEAVMLFAKENKIDTSTFEGFSEAEKGAKLKYSESFKGVA